MKYLVFKQFVCFAVLVLTAATSRADLVLDLRLDDGTRARNVASGSSSFVDLFLVDTDGLSSVSDFGLSGGGGKLLASGTAAGAGTLSFANPGFDFAVDSPVLGLTVPGIASIQAAVDIFSPVIAALPTGTGVTSFAGAAATEVFLARFAVTTTGGVGETLTLTPDRLVDFNGNADGLGAALDGLSSFISSSATESVSLTVSAAVIPEPSTLLVGSLLAFGGVVYWKRRRGSITTESIA